MNKYFKRIIVIFLISATLIYLSFILAIRECNIEKVNFYLYLPFIFYILTFIIFCYQIIIYDKDYKDNLNKISKYIKNLIFYNDTKPFDKKIPEDFIKIIETIDDIKLNYSVNFNYLKSQLTSLPGNRELQKEMFARIDSKEKFAVALVEIGNLSSYNHRYGFEKGDSVIRFTATLIINKVKESGNKEDFIAHIGSDDFVFVTTPDKVDKISSVIIRGFDDEIDNFYSKEDIEKGFILSKDKKGEIGKFSKMFLTIGVTSNSDKELIHPLQIGNTTSELVLYLKKKNKSDFIIDRRHIERTKI